VTKNIRKLGFKVIQIWEHDWNHRRKQKDVKECIEEVDTDSVKPLDPRDGFFGGRTRFAVIYSSEAYWWMLRSLAIFTRYSFSSLESILISYLSREFSFKIGY
jgi:hypothetical protein